MKHRSRQPTLKHEVSAAFEDLKYPGHDRVLDPDSHPGRIDEVEGYLGREWHTLDDDFLNMHTEGLSFFSRDAFAYYVPAFLLHALRSIHHPGDAVGSLIHSLDAGRPGSSLRAWKTARFNTMTQPQRIVIAKVLARIAEKSADLSDRKQAATALDRYWHNYLNK